MYMPRIVEAVNDDTSCSNVTSVQESFFGEMLMCGLGVARILSEAAGTGPRWGGTAGIEPFVPKGHIRHYEGELVRKHTVRLYFVVVGGFGTAAYVP